MPVLHDNLGERQRIPFGTINESMAVNFAACLLLIVQFLLGMVVNLYIIVPKHHPGSYAHNFFAGVASGVAWVIPSGPGWLAAHVIAGIVLVVAALANVLLSSSTGSRLYSVCSVLGTLAILGAAFNGMSFLNYGRSFSSMIMAGLWALAVGSYLTCLYLASHWVATKNEESSLERTLPSTGPGRGSDSARMP